VSGDVRHIGAFTVVWLCVGLTAASGQTPAGDEAPTLALRASLKSSVLLSRWPDDADLFPDRASTTGFWRLRVEPTVHLSERATLDLAFEQRFRVFSSASSGAGAGVLPSEAVAPFRLRQLDWRLASSPNAEWRGEIDRAALHVHLSGADLTIGRQAIGWGRGVLFGAVDLFSPFTPLEADREWRRGVDAVRADVKLGDRVSLDTVAAFADTLGRSSVATRLRGYAGKADVEILGGLRARDLFAGVTSSAAVGDVELHGELAWFRTPAAAGSIYAANDRSVVKAVAGGSYRLPFGNGVLLFGEYHYSGFGATSASRMLSQLADPAFHERYLRGDTQILGRHATAVLASYELSPELTLASQWIQSPVDGSGVVVPSTTWTLSDRWSVVVSGYLPYGREPDGVTLASEFGASPLAAFVQIKAYR
jgi:hypothetical protein